MIYLPIGHFSRKRARAAAAAAAGKVADDAGGTDGPDASDPILPKASQIPGESKARATGGAAAACTAAHLPTPDLERQPLLSPSPQPQRGTGADEEEGSESGTRIGGDGDDDGAGVGGERGAAEEEVGMRQIAWAAALVAPVWFAAQLTFTASLEFTSVTSNTVLSSCSSLFVYLGSLALGQEMGSNLRLASVLAAMAGTALVALGDSRSKGGGDGGGGGGGGSAPLLGDAMTLLAAALYACYTLIMKRLLVKDDGAVMALFFGCIGALCFAVLVPLAGGLAAAGAGVVTRVTAQALGLALVQGLVDYVAADYAWARAVMLLGPTATSCGLAMQIPAAAVVDSLVNGSRLAWSDTPASLVQFLFGSLLIVCGFIGVSLDPRVAQAAWERWKRRGRRGAAAAATATGLAPAAWHGAQKAAPGAVQGGSRVVDGLEGSLGRSAGAS